MPRAELFQSPRGSCSKRTVGTIEVQHTATTSCVVVAFVLRILQAMENPGKANNSNHERKKYVIVGIHTTQGYPKISRAIRTGSSVRSMAIQVVVERSDIAFW